MHSRSSGDRKKEESVNKKDNQLERKREMRVEWGIRTRREQAVSL